MYYGAAVLLHFVIPSMISVKYLQPNKTQSASHVKRDALRSFVPLVVKGISLYVAEVLHRKGFGVMKDTSVFPIQTLFKNSSDLLYLVSLLLLMDLFHDTWFYFSHRFLHSRWMMKHVHFMHHESNTPSAFTGYSFHWQVPFGVMLFAIPLTCVITYRVEAVTVFSVAVAEIFVFPIPFEIHRIYELWMILIHVGGHCGYEIFPFVPYLGMLLWLCFGGTKDASRWLNDVEHHDIHHRSPHYHFSLYFTHWDYIMGSMHPAYVKSRAQV